MATLSISPGTGNGRFTILETANEKTVGFQLRQTYNNSRNTVGSVFLRAGQVFEVPYYSMSGSFTDYVISPLGGVYRDEFLIENCFTESEKKIFPSKNFDEWFDVELGLNGITFPAFQTATSTVVIGYGGATTADYVIEETPQTYEPGTVVKVRVVDNPSNSLTCQRVLTTGTGLFLQNSRGYYVDDSSQLIISGTATSYNAPFVIRVSHNANPTPTTPEWSMYFTGAGVSGTYRPSFDIRSYC